METPEDVHERFRANYRKAHPRFVSKGTPLSDRVAQINMAYRVAEEQTRREIQKLPGGVELWAEYTRVSASALRRVGSRQSNTDGSKPHGKMWATPSPTFSDPPSSQDKRKPSRSAFRLAAEGQGWKSARPLPFD